MITKPKQQPMNNMLKSAVLKLKPLRVYSRVDDDRKNLVEKRQPTIDLDVDENDISNINAAAAAAAAPEEVPVPVEPGSTKRDGPNLCNMIANKRWEDIQELLTTEKDDFDIQDEEGPVTKELIIHHACSHKAPKDVLQSLTLKYWNSLYQSDSDGRFPIHVAALNGAGSDIMSFLINSNSASAGIRDALGKTPLHYVCEEYLEKNHGANSLKCHQDMFWTVGLLLKSAPSSVNIEDNEEMNPIELAIASGAHVGIIKEMQKASRRCWRARHLQRHDEYAQYIHDQCSNVTPTSKQKSCSNSAA